MKLSFQLADPQGETTLLVSTPVPSEKQAEVARRLLSIGELAAKSVVFLLPPAGKGVLRLEMAGGELNGTALGQAAMAFAVGRGIRREKKFSLEVAGCDTLLPVHPNPLTGQVTAEHPLPLPAEKKPFLGREVPVIRFPGMACALLKGDELPPEPDLTPALRALAQELDLPAAGAASWDFRAGTLRSARYLRQTDSLRYPLCCATSAAAVAGWQALYGQEGSRRLTLRQPGGDLQVTAAVQGGKLHRLTVSGPVVLGPVYNLEF